jgi:hypothetical protein
LNKGYPNPARSNFAYIDSLSAAIHNSEPSRSSIESQQIGSRLLPGASGGEIKDGNFFQQNPHRLADRMPMPWQNGHSRYSGSGPNASKVISSFHFSLSRSVVTEGSPILTCASLDISQSTAVTTERR